MDYLLNNLLALSHKYYNVPGIKAYDTRGNEHIYTKTTIDPLWVTGNGIYMPPSSAAYNPVTINTDGGQGLLNSWDGLVELSKSGYADKVLDVGGTISGTYTADGVTYDYPWIIMDFRTVELENGTTYDNVPILQSQYSTHTSFAYYSAQGQGSWALSDERQWLNSSTNFLSYMPADMISAIHPIKILSNTGSTIDETYNKFWVASLAEMCFSPNKENSVMWAYYKQLLNTDTLLSGGTYPEMIRYCVHDHTLGAGMVSVRTSESTYCYFINANQGAVKPYAMSSAYAASKLPCFALI